MLEKAKKCKENAKRAENVPEKDEKRKELMIRKVISKNGQEDQTKAAIKGESEKRQS